MGLRAFELQAIGSGSDMKLTWASSGGLPCHEDCLPLASAALAHQTLPIHAPKVSAESPGRRDVAGHLHGGLQEPAAFLKSQWGQ